MCDSLGNPIRFILTGGHESDYTQALALINEIKTTALLADKGYDADYIVSAMHNIGAQAVIPPKSGLLQNAPCGVSTRQKNPHLRSVNSGFFGSRSLPDTFCNSPKSNRKIQRDYDKHLYTRSKMKPGFQIVAGAYSAYVTRAIWKVFGPGFILGWVYKERNLVERLFNKLKNYTRSKMKPGFQIATGAYSSYVTKAIWKGIRSRFHFGMGIPSHRLTLR